jgi:hypothetical protein
MAFFTGMELMLQDTVVHAMISPFLRGRQNSGFHLSDTTDYFM